MIWSPPQYLVRNINHTAPHYEIFWRLHYRWSRPLFGLCQNVFAASVLSTALRLAAVFGSTHLCEEDCSWDGDKLIKIPKPSDRWTFTISPSLAPKLLWKHLQLSRDLQCHASTSQQEGLWNTPFNYGKLFQFEKINLKKETTALLYVWCSCTILHLFAIW
jgi:hypothetical protein